jgi:hypothetical protein
MNYNEILKKLSMFNDDNFSFDTTLHKYRYDSIELTSVTTLIGNEIKPKFKSDYWANIKAKERGISKKEILNEWRYLAKQGSSRGNIIHEFLEWKIKNNNQYININGYKKDLIIYNKLQYAQKIIDWLFQTFQYIIPELKVFNIKWKIAGTIDIIPIMSNGNIYIFDYKTNKNLSFHKYEKLLPPFNDLYNNDFNIYSLQISTYIAILNEIGLNLNIGGIISIPQNDIPKIIKTNDYIERIKDFLNNRNK